MQTKQELQVSIEKLKKTVGDEKTPPAIKKTLQMAIDKAEKQLGELIEAEKLAKSPKVTPKQSDKIDDVKQDSKDMVADLKAKLSSVKAKTKAKSVRLTNEDRKRVSKSIRKKQGLSTKNEDVERDAGRPALPKGVRVSKKTGNKYYEYRENRIDRRPQKYAKLEDGGGVDRYVLSFNYNPSIFSNENAEKIVSKYTKDWSHDNDWDEVSFYVQGLTNEKANELKKELEQEDVYNVEIEKGRYTFADGGEIKVGDFVTIDGRKTKILDAYTDKSFGTKTIYLVNVPIYQGVKNSPMTKS